MPCHDCATFCPSCQRHRPSSAFLTTTGPDPAGAFLRCRACIRTERDARRFITQHRAEARRNPASPVAARVRAAREVAARNVQAARVYADRFNGAHLVAA